MARERVVTRTINVTKVTAMCVNTLESKLYNEELYLTGEKYDKEKALKVAKKSYDTETTKVVDVINLEEGSVIYGMREIDFLKVATPMDENRHFIVIDDEETEETE